MSGDTRRQIDGDVLAGDLEEDARQALVNRAADLTPTRDAWHRITRDQRSALAEDDEED